MTGSLARRLAVAVTVVIVIVDIVLIGTAVRGAAGSRTAVPAPVVRTGTPAYPAPEMIVPTRLGASVRPDPMPAPRSSTGIAAPRPGAATAPTIEVLGESRTVGEESAPVPPAAPVPGPPRGDDGTASRPLLAVSVDGTVIRATRGRCPADRGASVEISTDFGGTFTPLAASAAQVLRVDAADGGELRIVATDRSCRPVARHSVDGGESWQPGVLTGIWYLSPDSDADQVLGPALVSTVGCVPRSLAASDDEHAAVSCVDGTVRVTDDGGDDWREVTELSGVTSLAVTGAGDEYALASVDGCASAVLRASGQSAGWSTVACLDEMLTSVSAAGGAVSLGAIAAAGTVVAAQVGAVFLLSTDTGATWTDPAR